MTGDSVSQLYLSNCLHIVGSSIIYYDHVITFADEWTHVWSNPRAGASLLFLLNRYVAFSMNFVVLASHLTPFKSVHCIVAVIQFLKTLALYGQDKLLASIMMSIAAVLTAVTIWSVVGQDAHISTAAGCHKELSHDTAVRLAVAWEALFSYDLMIFAFTLFRTYQDRRRYEKTRSKGLMALVVRDGAIYFAVMACAQCANTMTFYLLPPGLRGVLSTFASSISVTMMSRFMLKLFHTAAERKQMDMGTTKGSAERFTTTLFTTRISLDDDRA